jgi:hypothetical protein
LSGVTHISEYAFQNTATLESITFSNGVTNIGNYAVRNCYKLKSIVIYDSVTTIGKGVVQNSSHITDVYYTGTEDQWAQINIGEGNEYLTNATIHYNYER